MTENKYTIIQYGTYEEVYMYIMKEYVGNKKHAVFKLENILYKQGRLVKQYLDLLNSNNLIIK